MNHIEAILDFAFAPHVLPPQVRADAERLLADTLAVGAAGAVSPEALKLFPAVREWGTGNGARTLCGKHLPAPSAAFFNGFAIHCLEWDAVHEGAVVHALSVVTAALLAASDPAGGSNPDEFLTALAVGVDIASGLGLSATGPMKFFRPATAGVIGAALAVARLEGLSRHQMADVLGLAYSFAGGTMQAHVEASIALPLQIGNAARSAISAVDLIKAGMNGPHDALEGPFGYHSLIEPLDLGRYTGDLGNVWRISELSIKPFPSGRASHGVLGFLSAQKLEAAHIERLEFEVPPLIDRLVNRPMKLDMTPAYARLCLPFLTALMIVDLQIDPRRFTSETFSDPWLRDLAARVTVTVNHSADGNALSPQMARVVFTDGEVLQREIASSLGSPSARLSPKQYAAKYDLCRELAPNCDPRIFDEPLSYATDPNEFSDLFRSL